MPESAVCKSDLPMGYIGPVRKEPTAALEIAPNLALHRGLFPDDPVIKHARRAPATLADATSWRDFHARHAASVKPLPQNRPRGAAPAPASATPATVLPYQRLCDKRAALSGQAPTVSAAPSTMRLQTLGWASANHPDGSSNLVPVHATHTVPECPMY